MKLLWILAVCFLFQSCGISQDVINNTELIIHKVDSIGIEHFKKWDYRYRGMGVRTYYRRLGNNYQYSVAFKEYLDTLDIHSTSYFNFINDFEIYFDNNSNFKSALRIKQGKNSSRLIGYDNEFYSKDLVLIDKEDYVKYFRKQNPVEFFSRLNQIFDNVGIYETVYQSKDDEFVQFNLFNGYILTFLPSGIENTSSIKDSALKNDLDKGRFLNKYWNVRKSQEK
jgi:hypothetical protein